jgi:hypothetical protein
MNFHHWVTEKKGRAATHANECVGGKWPKFAIFGGKALKSLIFFKQKLKYFKNIYMNMEIKKILGFNLIL